MEIKFTLRTKELLKKILSVYIGVLFLIPQTAIVYAAELATPSATPELSNSQEATPSMMLNQLEATDSASMSAVVDIPVSSPAAALTTPTPTLELLTGPSGVLTPSASFKQPPHIRQMTKHTFRAGEVASVIVDNIDVSATKVTVRDNTGEAIDSTPSIQTYDGGVRVTVIPKTSMKPGEYTIVIEDASTGDTITQDFLWGVLAFNTDQATYNPGDIADIALAVLDEKGKMVCDADVTLTILAPSGKTLTLSTADGTIRVTPACKLHDYTLTPDYETALKTAEEGVYQVLLSATTKNGTYSIQDTFQVSSDMPFQVKRTSATRIYPPKPYPMTIDITANEDFSGVVTETVPENFTVTPLAGALPYADIKTIVPVTESQTPILLGMPFEGNYPVTLGFGDRIKDPQVKSLYEQNGLKGHDGADFAMPVGTQVLAADSGKILRIADNPYGTTVTIDHNWGRSYYGHLSVVQVKEGDTVAKGAPIALSGNTGLTTGSHLHFGMKLTQNDVNNGYYGKIDPMPYLTSSVIYQSNSPGQQISWNVTVKKDEKIRLGYTYKTPEVSPQFYLLGPLTFRATTAAVPAPIMTSDNPFVLGTATESASLSEASASAEATPSGTLAPSPTPAGQSPLGGATTAAPANSLVYQEPRRWQLAVDAAPNLPTLYPTAWSSTIGTAWSPNTSVNIDEGIAGADGVFNTAGINSVSQVFFEITDMPSDFVNMKTLNYDIRYKVTPLSNDTVSMYVQVFKSDNSTALTDEMLVVTTTTALTIRNKGSTAFTGVSTTATQADWNGAHFRIRTAYSKSGQADNSVWSIDAFEMTGTYQAAPTVTLTTPADGATGQSTTPALVFTGTDANSDEIEYNVQVDTVNTFDSVNNVLNLKYIDIGIDKNGTSPTDGVYIEVHSNSFSGTTLGTSNTLAASSIPSYDQSALTRFTFTTPISLSPGGVKFYFDVFRTGARDLSNYYIVYYSSPDTYSGGDKSELDSGTWTTSTTEDLRFVIYDTNTTAIVSHTNTETGLATIFGATGAQEAHGQSFTIPPNLPLLDKISTADTGFSGTGDPHPWPSGNAVTYTVQAADTLTAGLTYYWRVRGLDPSGSNTWGPWSPGSGSLGYQSFTTGSSAPTIDQRLRNGMWFNSSGVKQGFYL